MKIEIGESAIYSWLRHVKRCEITQLNWKVSPNWEQAIPPQIDELYDLFNREFNNPFKKNKGVSQAIKQAEIDVLGVNLQENVIYAIDTAFHKSGLNYGSKAETAQRVIKKLFRSLMIAKIYFPNLKHHIYFITPKITNSFEKVLSERFEEFLSFLNKNNVVGNVKMILGSDYDDIQSKLAIIAHEFHDSSELYIRSLQLNMLSANSSLPTKDKRANSQKISNSDSQEVANEINMITRRVPRWLQNTNQINSRILITYLELNKKHPDKVTLELLRSEVLNQYEDIDLNKFNRNFTQMSQISENNHGKVFDRCNDYIHLWEPVREFIESEFKSFAGN